MAEDDTATLSGEGGLLNTPTQRFYRGAACHPREVAQGVDRMADWLSGAWRRRGGVRRRLSREAAAALQLREQELMALDEEALRDRLREVHRRIRRGRTDRSLRIEALACVAQAASCVTGLTPYHVQLMGALAIGEGLFAEMATGEGKTLSIGLAGVLTGWRGFPCHIVTANDYLAKRDAEGLADFYQFCGLDVGHVVGDMAPEERFRQYQKPVVYTTSQQLLADHLRDRLVLGQDQAPVRRLIRLLGGGGDPAQQGLVMRGIHSVIIDEADNVLIDEAVTPLIISRIHPGESFAQCCVIARDLGHALQPGLDYRIDYKHSEITLRREGISAIGRHSHRLPAVWRSLERRNELVRQALVAQHFFERDKHYVVTADGVEIVDEFTGRILPGRTWKQGLHQAIEAKEGLPVTHPTETLASMSFQRFFRSFARIAGISGTARESSRELWRLYRLAVICIPTNRPGQRQVLQPGVFSTASEKFAAVVEEVAAMHLQGRPVLVGTRTVEHSEALSALLSAAGFSHEVLNAVRHREEAEIISRAGHQGQITIATNMAGRGTDIKIPPAVLALGGLHVIVLEHNLAARIDRQLLGRTARQGEPGSARCYLCSEDELFRRFLHPMMLKRVSAAVHWRIPGYEGFVGSACRKAQSLAERLGAKQRESVLQMDTWIEEHLSFARAE